MTKAPANGVTVRKGERMTRTGLDVIHQLTAERIGSVLIHVTRKILRNEKTHRFFV